MGKIAKSTGKYKGIVHDMTIIPSEYGWSSFHDVDNTLWEWNANVPTWCCGDLVAAKATSECRHVDLMVIVCFYQDNVVEYIWHSSCFSRFESLNLNMKTMNFMILKILIIKALVNN